MMPYDGGPQNAKDITRNAEEKPLSRTDGADNENASLLGELAPWELRLQKHLKQSPAVPAHLLPKLLQQLLAGAPPGLVESTPEPTSGAEQGSGILNAQIPPEKRPCLDGVSVDGNPSIASSPQGQPTLATYRDFAGDEGPDSGARDVQSGLQPSVPFTQKRASPLSRWATQRSAAAAVLLIGSVIAFRALSPGGLSTESVVQESLAYWQNEEPLQSHQSAGNGQSSSWQPMEQLPRQMQQSLRHSALQTPADAMFCWHELPIGKVAEFRWVDRQEKRVALFVWPRGLSDAPKNTSPGRAGPPPQPLRNTGGLQVAVWQNQGNSYVLVVEGGAEDYRRQIGKPASILATIAPPDRQLAQPS